MAQQGFLDIVDLRGGQNSADAPLSLRDNQVVEAVNVDWSAGTLGRKRDGMAAMSPAPDFQPTAMLRHTPTEDESAAELWITNDFNLATYAPASVRRLVAGVWTTPTLTDGILTRGQNVCAASLNGKLFLAYRSAVERLHVWDGSTVRRAGIAAPAVAPTAADSGAAGTYSGVRYYRQRFVSRSGSVVLRRSEPSPVLTFTPVGNKTSVTVTMAALPAGEAATDWELYASSDNANFWLLATVGIETTTYTDSAAVSSYSSGDVDYAVGEYLPFPSVKYLLTDENRLIGAGHWETAAYASRLVFSPVTGSGVSDDERSPDSNEWMNHLDLDAQDGGGITGLGGPINNSPYVFKLSQIYKLVRTGKAKNPYRPVTVSKTFGCIGQKTIVKGVDETGNDALYFLSTDGPRRLSSTLGMQWLGNDIRDVWARVNLSAGTPPHGVYYADLKQVWFWVPLDGATSPNAILVFDTRLGQQAKYGVSGGWSVYTGNLATAKASVMFANTLGAENSLDLKPYVGVATQLIAKAGTGTSDAGTAFRSYVLTKPYFVGGLGRHCGAIDGTLLAKSASGVAIQVTVSRDFGVEERDFSVSLTPAASETRVIRQVEDLSMADATSLQFEIGDASAVVNAWTLEALTVRTRQEGLR